MMRDRVQGHLRFLLENSFFLIGGTLTALVWANVDHASYEEVARNLHFFINEIAMAFFFGIAAKEVYEALLPGGPLSSPRKAAMPLLATLGGISGPAAIYVVGGLLILALFYPTGAVNFPIFLALVAAAILLAVGLKRWRVTNFWPYIGLCGAISWVGFYLGGIHPALALVPVVFFMPHALTDVGLFANREKDALDTLNQFRHWWRTLIEIILGLVGFVNAGVAFTSVGAGTWLVTLGLVLGKSLGITLFSLLGRAFGLSLPTGMRWANVIVLGCAAGIGFTVALFVSTVAFPPSEYLDMAKMGALFSFGSMFIAIIAGKLLRVQPVRGEVNYPQH